MSQPNDQKVYLSAYVGMGQEARAAVDTLRAGARRRNLSLGYFLITEALKACRADTTPKTTPSARESIRAPSPQFPVPKPRLRPTIHTQDDDRDIPIPKISGDYAPSSKPSND